MSNADGSTLPAVSSPETAGSVALADILAVLQTIDRRLAALETRSARLELVLRRWAPTAAGWIAKALANKRVAKIVGD